MVPTRLRIGFRFDSHVMPSVGLLSVSGRTFSKPCFKSQNKYRQLKTLCTMTTAPSAFPQRGQPLPSIQQAGCVYLDYNATTPIWPEVAEEMKPFLFQYFGNPSSAHMFGQPCRGAVDLARCRVANLVGAKPHEIFFTSCGSESDSWAIWSAVMSAKRQSPAGVLPHVVTTCIEHPAVLECLEAWRQLGLLEYTAVPVSSEGLVAPADIESAITPATALITVMHSNNEVGSLQPICEIASIAHAHEILLHSDAAQSIGKVAVDVRELGVDMLTIVGHKFGASKGVAALFVREGVEFERFLSGGGQESGRRGGTENVPLIVGLGKAAEIAQQELPEAAQQLAAARDQLRRRLTEELPAERLRFNGPTDPTKQLPNTLSISIKGVVAFQLLSQMSERLAASAGAACHSQGGATVSPVLKALKVPEEYAIGTLRLSVGRHTTLDDIEKATAIIAGYCV